MRLPLLGLALVATSTAGCMHHTQPLDAGEEDAGSAVDAGPPPADAGPGYDPTVGNRFDGPLDLSDTRVTGMDPTVLPAAGAPCREPVLVRVRYVVDGDTFDVAGISEPLDESVRFIGVDAPEIAHSGSPADCYGPEASTFTQQLRDHIVWLTFDAECRDRFDRLLAYVWVGQGPQDLWERQLLRRGLATVLSIAPNTSKAGIFHGDETAARNDGAGLWSTCP